MKPTLLQWTTQDPVGVSAFGHSVLCLSGMNRGVLWSSLTMSYACGLLGEPFLPPQVE